MMLLDRSNHDDEFAAGFTEFGVTVKKIRLSEVQGLIYKTHGLNRKRNNYKQVPNTCQIPSGRKVFAA